MKPFKVISKEPIGYKDVVEEWTPGKIREIWVGETPETSVVLALLKAAEDAEERVSRLEEEVERLLVGHGERAVCDHTEAGGCADCYGLLRDRTIKAEARAESLTGALLAVRGRDAWDGPCWCLIPPQATHDSGCERARRATLALSSQHSPVSSTQSNERCNSEVANPAHADIAERYRAYQERVLKAFSDLGDCLEEEDMDAIHKDLDRMDKGLPPSEMTQKVEGKVDKVPSREEVCEAAGDDEILFCDGLDSALMGYATVWQVGAHIPVAAYDYHKCVKALVAQGMSVAGAEEWLDFNTMGAFVGDRTPVFVFTGGGPHA